MSVSYGNDSWPCACGCGEIIIERLYLYDGKTTRRRPRWLNGHRARQINAVKAEPVFQAIRAYKTKHGLTWREIDALLGYAPALGYAKDRSRLSPTRSLVTSHRETMSRELATRHLRRLAGLPTEPTLYEQREALRPAISHEELTLTPLDRMLLNFGKERHVS